MALAFASLCQEDNINYIWILFCFTAVGLCSVFTFTGSRRQTSVFSEICDFPLAYLTGMLKKKKKSLFRTLATQSATGILQQQTASEDEMCKEMEIKEAVVV